MPWRRPGFELGLQIEALHRDNPGLRGVVLGGHGLTTWGDTSDGVPGDVARRHRPRPSAFIAEHGRPDPFGPVRRRVRAAARPTSAGALAAALAPVIRGPVLDRPARRRPLRPTATSCSTSSPARPSPRLVPLGTSCPDHFIRTKVRPLLLDLPPTAPVDELVARLRELHAAYRDEYAAYYRAPRHAPTRRRCAAPTRRSCSCPASACSASAPTPREARIAGEFYVNAINVMRGAEALSTYAPIAEAEKFRIEYWALEEAKLPAPARRPSR